MGLITLLLNATRPRKDHKKAAQAVSLKLLGYLNSSELGGIY